MRSELIFRARETVANKYKLCQTASKATRQLHIASKNTTDTINSALTQIADGFDIPMPAVAVGGGSWLGVHVREEILFGH